MFNVLQYLESAAKRFSDKLAISDGHDSLTYAELVNKALQIGARLAVFGKQDSPVCVYSARTVDTMVYFLGVLYSGNYYVPIDPDMPREKAQMIIEDCRPFAICGAFDAALTGTTPPRILLSDPHAESFNIAIPEKEPRAPAYMIYTSGSTGKPKGVIKSHGSVISFVEAYCETFDFSSDDIIGSQTPFFFDASAKDIYLSLKLGATLEVIPIAKFAMPTDLIEYLNERRISFISWVPTALSIVAQLKTLNYVLPQYLKKVFFVGEVMPMKYLNYWREKLPHLQYVNLYGQSELAGICCFYEVKKTFSDSETLPMGTPLSNCKLYLMDNGKIISETGRIGEIYVVSDALANEYFGDPDKTSASFIFKDFGDGMVRCFKSGDLASLDESGNFIFASRSDFQIKHLGHRIELGEIEAVAGALDEIVRCCCLYNAEKQAMVLFVEAADETVTPRALKSALRQKLSSYMVPEKVKIIDKMPINANGKINRQKLKEML